MNREKALQRPVVEKQLRAKALDDMTNAEAKLNEHIDGDKSQLATLANKISELGQADRPSGWRPAGGKSNGDVDGRQAEVTALETEVKKSGEELATLESSLPLTPRLTVTEAAAVPMLPCRRQTNQSGGSAPSWSVWSGVPGVAATEFRGTASLQIGRREPGSRAAVDGHGSRVVGEGPRGGARG